MTRRHAALKTRFSEDTPSAEDTETWRQGWIKGIRISGYQGIRVSGDGIKNDKLSTEIESGKVLRCPNYCE